MREKAFRACLYGSLALLVGSGIFSAVLTLIWPVTEPAWADRSMSAAWLLAVLLAAAAAVIFFRGRPDGSP